MALGQQLNRRGLQPMAAAGGTRRLGVDGEQAVPGGEQRVEDRRGKIRGAHEDEVQPGAPGLRRATGRRP